jgi:hypothetical protein
MTTEILHADRRLRRVTIAVLAIAALVALGSVHAYQTWLTQHAASMPMEQLVARLRHDIGIAVIASGVCLLLLAGYAGRMANRVKKERRWPLSGARVLRDTPIRREQAALRIGRLLDIAAFALILFGVAAVLLSWRLFSAVH